PSAGSMPSPRDAVTLVAAASDTEDGDLGSAVAWTSSLDGPLGEGAMLAVGLRSGTHTITATATDGGGKTAEATIALVVNAAPTAMIVAPADGSVFEPGVEVTLAGTAADAEDGDLGGAIVWTSSLDGPLGTGSPLGVSTLRSGTHTITASVTDRGGKSAGATLTIVVDAAPTLTIAVPSSGTTFAPDESVTLTASATDAEDGDLTPLIGWTSSLQGPLGGGTLGGGTLQPGTHVLTASVTDSGGKSASAATTIVVAPLIMLQGSRSTAYTNQSLAAK